MEQRFNFQDWDEGRKDVFEFFWIGEGNKFCAGLECNGMIAYYHPSCNNYKKGLVMIGINDFSDGLKAFCEIPKAFVDEYEKQCPSFVQAFKDGMEGILDRGAYAIIENRWFLVKSIDFDFVQKAKELKSELMLDSIIVDTAVYLRDLQISIYKEINSSSGFSLWKSVQLAAKEDLPELIYGAKVGYRIFSVLSGLGIF